MKAIKILLAILIALTLVIIALLALPMLGIELPPINDTETTTTAPGDVYTTATTQPPQSEPNAEFSINFHTPEAVSQAQTVHEYRFSEPPYYSSVVLQTNQAVHGFSIIGIGSWYDDDGFYRYVAQVRHTVGEFAPSDALVLHVYLVHRLDPAPGIAFTDAAGARHYAEISRCGCCHELLSLTPFEPAPLNG